MGDAKVPIKKGVEFNIKKQENIRQIESVKHRTVHFIYDPQVPVKITPFSRKYVKMLDGTLEEFE